MIEQHHQETCKCCGGTGVQVLISGERIVCAACGGAGMRWVSNFDNLPPGVYCLADNSSTISGGLPMKRLVAILSLLLAPSLLGCDGVTIGDPPQQPQPPVCPDGNCPREAESPYQSVPPMDIPVALREPNYGSGSCMHAAFIAVLRWQGQYNMADWWRQNHRGGETVPGLAQSADKAGLRFAYTANGDEGFLDWCSRTRRGAVIHWRVSRYSDHAICFCGYAPDGQAVLMDNNRPQTLLRMSREKFLHEWHANGGYALTCVYAPLPPRPWATPALRVRVDVARPVVRRHIYRRRPYVPPRPVVRPPINFRLEVKR